MMVISTGPVWTVEDTKKIEEEWNKIKTPTTRSDFARKNLENQGGGGGNLTCCDIQNYFPGAMHLAIRSVETLSVQIGMCAVGKLGYITSLALVTVLTIKNDMPDTKMIGSPIKIISIQCCSS